VDKGGSGACSLIVLVLEYRHSKKCQSHFLLFLARNLMDRQGGLLYYLNWSTECECNLAATLNVWPRSLFIVPLSRMSVIFKHTF